MIDFSSFPTTVGIVGSRKYKHLKWIDLTVSRLAPDRVIVSGGASGVDTAAEQAADKYGLKKKIFKIDNWEWETFGNKIAYVRNSIIVFYVKSLGGHIIIFAVEKNGVLTEGSQMVRTICEDIGCDYTVINDEGEVLWTTSARIATKK